MTETLSLAADPVEEVKVGWDILKSLHLRQRGINLIACPSCSRQNFDVIKVVAELERRFEDIDEPLDVAVIGCVVNGPGESRHADIGISLPGTGEAPAAPVFIDGEKAMTLRGENIAEDFVAVIDGYVARRYAG